MFPGAVGRAAGEGLARRSHLLPRWLPSLRFKAFRETANYRTSLQCAADAGGQAAVFFTDLCSHVVSQRGRCWTVLPMHLRPRKICFGIRRPPFLLPHIVSSTKTAWPEGKYCGFFSSSLSLLLIRRKWDVHVFQFNLSVGGKLCSSNMLVP